MKALTGGIKIGFYILCVSVFAGCATKVTRVETTQKIDISGEWNDYDAMLVSQEMIKNCLQSAWLNSFVEKNKRPPTVIVSDVTNRSDEHINTQVFIKDLEKELTNSGKVIFVVSLEEREQIRTEREDQQRGYTSNATKKPIGQETGADFMLIGSLNSVKDAVKKKAVVLYQVNLEMIDLTTNEKVWIGQKELKKQIDRPQMSL